MIVLRARNVHDVFPMALELLHRIGVNRDSRNGPVRVFPEPVTTVYEQPAERVLFWAERDANPFFHFFEALWMLAGRRDVESIALYAKRMRSFSDDGVSLHGAYGYRWRSFFGFDQLPTIIETLRKNPNDRRQVLTMWAPVSDLGQEGKDFPCNLQALFQITSEGNLDMTVTNRSNDLIWGAYGANAVHFSALHEFMARSIGVPQGVYRQVSNNLHAYLDTLKDVEDLRHFSPDPLVPSALREANPYGAGLVVPFPMMEDNDYAGWLGELSVFLDNPDVMGLRFPFFRNVANPILRAHRAYRDLNGLDRYAEASAVLQDCKALDWKRACLEWLDRRRLAYEKKFARADDDGPRAG